MDSKGCFLIAIAGDDDDEGREGELDWVSIIGGGDDDDDSLEAILVITLV